jgi:hypothetical protein
MLLLNRYIGWLRSLQCHVFYVIEIKQEDCQLLALVKYIYMYNHLGYSDSIN